MNWIYSIRTKLFALVFIAFFTLIAGTYWQVGEKAKSVADTVIDQSLTQSSKILETRIDSRFRFIQEIATGLAQDGRILPLVYDQDTPTLQDLSLEFERTYEFDILFFMNSQGDILARTDQPQAIGVNLARRSALFDSALNGQITSGFIISNNQLMQTVAAPIFDNVASDLVRGVIVIAYELSQETAQEIVALTESDIGFFVFNRDNNRVIDGVNLSYMTNTNLAQSLSAYFDNDSTHWNQIIEQETNDFRTTLIIDDAPYHSVIRRIISSNGNALGFAVATRSDAELKQPFIDIQNTLLAVGGMCLVIASIVSLFMALGLSRPIIRLVTITQQIQEGLYPDSKDYKNSKDEIGLLRTALLDMGQSLKDKAEVEAYLADIANELNDERIQLDETHLSEHKNGGDTVLANKPANEEDKTLINQAAPTQKNDNIGSIIDGRYKLLESLGSGAFASVFLAHDMELNDRIAIKIIHLNTIKQFDEFNFKEEIRLARKITHRNIVRTFDFGQWQTNFYITMEYVQGIDLGQLIRRQRHLDDQIALGICKQICTAVMAAHQMGIIHRDLKPSNMMINRQGILQIMDFGLAKKIQKENNDKNADNKNKQIMGTPRYMAPEQFLGNDQLDERTDVYAIGVIFYTIFNGIPPFSGVTLKDIAQKHLHEQPPQIISRNLPKGFANILEKALAKQPNERYQSARELLDAVNHITAVSH